MKRNTIGFSFNRSNGGPSNFLKNLKSALEDEDIANTSYYINPFTSFNIYANVVRNPWKKPYFFRVDGIGFDKSKTDKEIYDTNREIINGIKNARGVIYQSKFSKKLAEKTFSYIPKNSEVIINGTNTNIFSADGKNYRKKYNISKDSIVFITSSKWRTQKRLKDIFSVFKEFSDNYTGDTYLFVIGFDGESDNNIINIPHIENNELPAYLRTADIYLFFSWIDSCPNSVVEAISCGLPVICTNIGGTKEIIEITNGGIVVNADPEYNFELVDLNNPPLPNHQLLLDAMNKISTNLDSFKKGIDDTKINIKYVARKYYNFMANI